MKTYVHLLYYLAEFFLEWEHLRAKRVKKIKSHISRSLTFSRKSYRLWDNVENWYNQTGHRWQYNVAQAHFMLDN